MVGYEFDMEFGMELKMKKISFHKNHKSIRASIISLVLMTVIPFLVIALYETVLLDQLHVQYDRNVQNITSVNKYNTAFENNMNSCMYYIIVETYDWSEIKDQESNNNPYYLIDDMRQHFNELRQTTNNANIINDIDSVQRVLNNLEKKVDKIMANIKEGNHYDDNIEILRTDINEMTGFIQNDIENYIYLEACDMEKMREDISAQMQRTLILLLIFIACAAIETLIVSRTIVGKITDPISDLCQKTHQFADGDFSVRIDTPSNVDEIRTLSVSFNQMVTQISDLVEDVCTEQKNLRNLELKLFQAQITPHFLYNTLDAIMWLIEAGENEQAESMLSSLSNFFRTSLSKGRDWITVREEESHIRSYLEIQQFRYRDILRYEINILEDMKQFYLMKLMLQPIVENALYHGIKNKRSLGHIIVNGKHENGEMIFTVTDDGIGMTEEELDHMRKLISGEVTNGESDSGGFGISNVEQRIQLNYGEKYGIHVSSTYGKGTCVTLNIPEVDDPEKIHDSVENRSSVRINK